MSFRYRIQPILVSLTLVLVLASCRTFDVRTDWDDTVNFERLTRFYLLDPPLVEGTNPFADNTLLRKRVRKAMRSVLLDSGYFEASTRHDANFVVTYQVLVGERLRVDSISSSIGTRFRRRRWGAGSTVSTTSVSDYQESTLLIDVLDPESSDLIWRGWGTGIVGTRDRDRGVDRLADGVRAIFRKFPPEETSKRRRD